MRYLLLLLLALPSIGSAATCPTEVTVKFGNVIEGTRSQMSEIEGKELSFKKIELWDGHVSKKVCTYSGSGVFLLKVVVFNLNGPAVRIERREYDENPGYILSASLKEGALDNTVFDLFDVPYDVYAQSKFDKISIRFK